MNNQEILSGLLSDMKGLGVSGSDRKKDAYKTLAFIKTLSVKKDEIPSEVFEQMGDVEKTISEGTKQMNKQLGKLDKIMQRHGNNSSK